MADDHSPDESNLTKRERQKARRAQRQEAERAAAARARRTRIGVLVLVGVLVAGTAGYFVQQNLAERSQERSMIEDARADQAAFGCTDVEEMPPLGAGHFSDAELAPNPPETAYAHLPTTSGPHIASVIRTGVYDEYVDERLTTHNLEHGYVVMWYDEDAADEQVTELEEFAQERIDAGDQELIVAPYNQPFEGDANFAFASWERRQLCEEFSPGIALGFINENMNAERAPETFAGPHTGERQGELDPDEEDGPLVFPPLSDDGAEAPSQPPEDGGAEGDAAPERLDMDSGS